MDTVYDTIGSGWTVYTADVRKVGAVSEVNTREGYLVVQKGWLFPRDLFVPLEVIAAIGEGTVRLLYDREQVEAEDWSAPPPPRDEEDLDVHDEPTVVLPTAATTPQHQPELDASGDVDERQPERDLAGEADSFPTIEGAVPEPQTLDIGGHTVQTEVVEELETVEVPVRHEELHVVHVPAEGIEIGDNAFQEMDFEIPLMGERLHVAKHTRVVEVVRVLKRAVTEVQQVTDTVRKERVRDDR